MNRNLWKQRERDIAREFFDSSRNPLSGRNNISDSGERRPGDVIYSYALVEVKLRQKHAALSRAKVTAEEAKKLKKPWIHIETLKGTKKIFCLCMSKEDAKECIKYLRKKWENN